jgi:hypothetical protein
LSSIITLLFLAESVGFSIEEIGKVDITSIHEVLAFIVMALVSVPSYF